MLDVHAPHHAATTWRDFFIHIATICIGLLIAIGLEQSVEWLHHRHQREQFIADMQHEASANLTVIFADHKANGIAVLVCNGFRAAIETAPAHNGIVTVDLTPEFVRQFDAAENVSTPMPSIAVWTTGKQSQMVPLLPAGLAQLYERLSYTYDTVYQALLQTTDTARQIDVSLARILHLPALSIVDGKDVPFSLAGHAHLVMTEAQRDQLADQLASMGSQTVHFDHGLSSMLRLEQAVIDGTPSLEAYWQQRAVPVSSASSPNR